ncbi:transport and Golgi organization protein 6 homolog [Epargyreus clarus]|uniref:transport and Golgi organization protein 6 homolog n=1 Tax=Epargyreus clarus TaxID=520877 RepID=UPI003C2E6752
MAKIDQIFKRIEKVIDVDHESKFIHKCLKPDTEDNKNDSITNTFTLLKEFLESIFREIDELSNEIKSDPTILISVKNQKLLRKCFQLIVSFGTSQCLIPGLGICLTKRCISTNRLQQITLNDEQKYDILVTCTDFFTRCYEVPVLKSILTTFHLCDYLASLIQLSFAPLKKPGTYTNFTMTEEMYQKLNADKKTYLQIYEKLVVNCFQPMLMKELLVLQNVTDQTTPAFVKRVIAKELSRRLIAPGGLLSLIRCFIENYDGDTGHDWKKIDMICKIVATKHGNLEESDYLYNITGQLKQILTINNVQYLATAITCILYLAEKYPDSLCVRNLKTDIVQCLDSDLLLTKSNLPGTIILTAQEVEHKINILHCTLCVIKFEWDATILASNLYVLYLLGIKCTKEELKTKIKDIILKCLELVDQKQMVAVVKCLLYGNTSSPHISIEAYEAGLAVKCVSEYEYPKAKATLQLIELFNATTNNDVIQKLFSSCLELFIYLDADSKRSANEKLFSLEDNVDFISDYEENQCYILQLLTEITSSPNAVMALKKNPMIVINFVENLLLRNVNTSEEYVTIALVLLNTILSNINRSPDVEKKLHNLVPALQEIVKDNTSYNALLCKDILSFISSEYPKQVDSAYAKALSDVYDNLLPVRAHGIMELTKLIDANDPETISKRHYVFCLLQEQLKDSDSYIYLSAINGIASLATHCTEDVLMVLCREFLQISRKHDIQTNQSENSVAELRMKVGDIIVKVTKRLGEMAIMHKATLLNTMLCACRDNDPYIRTSALSNLAEIALVLHYKMGTIIYEVLLCIWSIIETDKAIDCRRAAVMVISSLLKGLGRNTLIELKENLLPIYRTLNKLYKDENEDSVVRLHSQIALEELNSIVNQFLFSEVSMDRKFVLNEPKDIVFK